jgi:predicted transcriptional regulator
MTVRDGGGRAHGTGERPAARRAPGALESEVLAVLWGAEGALTPADIQALLPGPLAYNTVHTILKRLYDKGMVRRDADGRRGAYRPATDAAQRAADLMARVLETAPDPAAALLRFADGLSEERRRTLRNSL